MVKKKGTGAESQRLSDSEDFLTYLPEEKRGDLESSAKELIGDRVRRIREDLGLTLKDLSSRTGIDIGLLKSVESNQRIPALGEVVKLGKALQTRVSYLLSPGADKPVSIVRADQRRPVSRYGEKRSERYGYSYESLAPEKADRLMEPFIVTLSATDVEEPSSHDGQEFIFVLEGQIMVKVGGVAETLGPGDSLYYDSSKPHLVTCAGGTQARIMAVICAGHEQSRGVE